MFTFLLNYCSLLISKGNTLIIKNEVGATDQSTFSMKLGCNAVRNHILHSCMFLTMLEVFLCGLSDNCPCNTMRKMFLKACCCTQNILFGVTGEGNYIDNLRACNGKCSGFVKHNCVGKCKLLQVLSSLYHDVHRGCLTHSGDDRDRCGEFESTGIINHQDRQCPRQVAGKEKYACSSKEAVGNNRVRKLFCFVLHICFQCFGLIDKIHNFVNACFSAKGSDCNCNLSFLYNSTCIYSCTGCFVDREGFTGHRGFVNHCISRGDHTINRNHGSSSYNHLIALGNLGDGD